MAGWREGWVKVGAWWREAKLYKAAEGRLQREGWRERGLERERERERERV